MLAAMRGAWVLMWVVLFSTAAHAQEPPAQPADPERSLSLTLSPLHLLPVEQELDSFRKIRFLILEVTGELPLSSKVGVAGILGIGRATITSSVDDATLLIGELGGQVNYYALGGFARRNSLQLGAEVMLVMVRGEEDGVTGVAEGVAVGPYLGYKFVGRGGFTFVGQIGYQVWAVKAESSDGGMSEQSDGGPLVNLNVGWSF